MSRAERRKALFKLADAQNVKKFQEVGCRVWVFIKQNKNDLLLRHRPRVSVFNHFYLKNEDFFVRLGVPCTCIPTKYD